MHFSQQIFAEAVIFFLNSEKYSVTYQLKCKILLKRL